MKYALTVPILKIKQFLFRLKTFTIVRILFKQTVFVLISSDSGQSKHVVLAKHKNWMERNEYKAGDSYHWSVESHEERLVSYEIATKTLL